MLNERRPRILSAHGSYLGALYRHAHRTGKKIHRPQVAVYCADAPSECDRALIEETYAIQVLSVYRSGEALKIGFTCEAGTGFHLHPDLCALYLADPQGRPVADGEPGEVVISNLLNRATVLLNYRLGDIAALDRDPCPCGRTVPRLRSLEGRADELLTLPDGDALDPSRIKGLFLRRRDVELYQVVQRGPRSFHVRVQPVPGALTADLEASLQAELLQLLGVGTAVRIEFVEEIPTDGQTKFRAIVPWKGETDPAPQP
ncbi:MAG: phenylacetate--CoA ligase family protein [Proteobacteria bacterium]|nr:phenylacetate--CoA ligase family protein [Pseudomonadota bacterium]